MKEKPKAIERSLDGVRLVDMPQPAELPDLEALRKTLRACLAVDNGPLIHAKQVCGLEGMWDRFKRDAGGVSFEKWIRVTCGPEYSARFWRRCNNAVNVLGEHVRRTLHHQVALFIAERLDEANRDGAVTIIGKARRSQNMHLVSLKSAKSLLRKSGHWKPRPVPQKAACLRCKLLERLLEKHGIDWRKELKEAA